MRPDRPVSKFVACNLRSRLSVVGPLDVRDQLDVDVCVSQARAASEQVCGVQLMFEIVGPLDVRDQLNVDVCISQAGSREE